MYRLNHWSDQYFHSYCKIFLCILCNLLCILIRVSYMTLYCTLSCRHNWLILIVHQVQGKQSLLWVSLLSSISINPSQRDQVVLIGKDTDLLVLLLHHYDINSPYELFFTTGKSVTNKKIWNIGHAMNCLPDYVPYFHFMRF